MATIVVVPTYNEADNLRPLTDALLRQPDCTVLVVDDNSPDGTGQLADALASQHPDRVLVLHRPGKQGLGTAYLAGFREAMQHGCDFVVQMDADFSHDPADVPRLVAAAATADLAIGSRYAPGGRTENWPRSRWLMSRGGALYTQLILGLPVRDPTGGFKCFRRDALAQIDLDAVRARNFGFQLEMNWRCYRQGLRLVEVPICFADRKRGRSKMSWNTFFESLWLVWALRLRPPPSTPQQQMIVP
jgi:dolichol-phosphate mannosyltransferase